MISLQRMHRIFLTCMTILLISACTAVPPIFVGLATPTATSAQAVGQPDTSNDAPERSLIWERFDVDILVKIDGTFDVAEHQRIRFTAGTFTLGYREITVNKFGYIDNWAITDGSGNRYQLVSNGSQPYTFTVDDSGYNYVIRWYFPAISDTSETYSLAYTVHNGLRLYEAGDQLWWKAIFSDRSFPILDGRIKVTVPADIQEWAAYINAHDARDSASATVLEGRKTIVFDLDEQLNSGQDFEVRVQFPHGVVAGTAQNWQASADLQVADLESLDKTIALSLARGDGSVDPILPLAYQRRSELRAGSGDLPGAIADLEASLAIDPWQYNNFQVLTGLRHRLAIRQATFAEDPSILLANLNDRLTKEPDDVQALIHRGFLFLQLAFIDDSDALLKAAHQDFTSALALDPERAEAYHGRALALWMAAENGRSDIDDFLTLADTGETVNFSIADAGVTIVDGTVTMTNTLTGAVSVQSVDEWQATYTETLAIKGATPEMGLADLEMALSLVPDLVAARHDRGVMRLRAWSEDGLMTMLTDGPSDSSNEALVAALSDLDFAVQQSPDWATARLSRGIANFFQAVTVNWGYDAAAGDTETAEIIQSSWEEAIADATWLIDHDPSSGWAYFMRVMAMAMTIYSFQNFTGDRDPAQAALMETDAQRCEELLPDLNSDNILLQFADQVRLSLQVAPAPLISSGALELNGEKLFYTNADYGLRLQMPESSPSRSYSATSAGKSLWLRMADDFRIFNVLVLQPPRGDSDVQAWLEETRLRMIPPGKQVESQPLQTQFGPAMLFTSGDGAEAATAILSVGDYLFSFEYAPSSDESEDYNPFLGIEIRPLDVVLAEFIYGLEIDGVAGNQPIDPRLGSILAMRFRAQGYDAREQGDYEEAVRLFRLAIEYDPDFAPTLNSLAWTLAYHLQTELEAALGYALRAVELDPDPSYYDTLGMAHYRLQQYDEALAAYTEALTLEPDLAASLLGRADVYVELSENEKAIQDLKHYIKVKPYAEDVDDIRARIEALGESGVDAENAVPGATPVADTADEADIEPELDASALLNQGNEYLKAGETDKAMAAFSDALSLDPENVEVLLNRGVVYLYQDDCQNALSDLDVVVRLDPKNITGYNYRAVAQYCVEDYAMAVRDCGAAIELAGPYISPVTISLSVLNMIAELTRTEPAMLLQAMDAALAEDPGLAEAYLVRGFARWHLDDVEGAVADFEQAHAMTYVLGVFVPMWSTAFAEPDDPDKAIESFEEALALVEPDSFLVSLIQGTLDNLRATRP